MGGNDLGAQTGIRWEKDKNSNPEKMHDKKRQVSSIYSSGENQERRIQAEVKSRKKGRGGGQILAGRYQPHD